MRAPGVLICIPTLSTGGAERQLRLLAPRLAARGIRVGLFSRIEPAYAAALEAQGVRCFQAPRRNHSPRMPTALGRAARGVEADIVHSFLPQMDIVGGAVARLTGRVWLLSERSSAPAYGSGLKDRLRFRLGRRATAIVANSAAGLDVWPGHPDRSVIANGIDHRAIAAAPPLPEADRRAVAGRMLIVSVARLSAEKRLDLLIDAVRRLRETHPGLLLLLIGRGPEEAALKARAEGLGDQVRFLGFRPDAWSWLAAADLFVSASRFEGHPNAVLEAAAAGAPMVLSDIPMHRDAAGGDGALYVPPGDAGALAEGIAALIADPAARDRLGAAARAHVASFSIEDAADRYAALYRRLAAASGS